MKILLALAVVAAGCADAEGRFPVVIQTMTDDGKPFSEVVVTLGSSIAGKTAADGKLSVIVRGKEGTKVNVSVEAPPGYRLAASTQPALVLRRLTDIEGGRGRVLPVEHVVRFAPLQRQYAVLVRVGVPGLQVETFGVKQTVTNSKGVAAFLYQGAPGDELQVKVSTADHAELRPQNPTSSFLLGQRSEAYVVHQTFNVYKAKVKVKKPVHVGPKRL